MNFGGASWNNKTSLCLSCYLCSNSMDNSTLICFGKIDCQLFGIRYWYSNIPLHIPRRSFLAFLWKFTNKPKYSSFYVCRRNCFFHGIYRWCSARNNWLLSIFQFAIGDRRNIRYIFTQPDNVSWQRFELNIVTERIDFLSVWISLIAATNCFVFLCRTWFILILLIYTTYSNIPSLYCGWIQNIY